MRGTEGAWRGGGGGEGGGGGGGGGEGGGEEGDGGGGRGVSAEVDHEREFVIAVRDR